VRQATERRADGRTTRQAERQTDITYKRIIGMLDPFKVTRKLLYGMGKFIFREVWVRAIFYYNNMDNQLDAIITVN